jgi:ribonuclease VapC
VLLAKIFREPGHERVSLSGSDAVMSAVNLAEVLSRLIRDSLSLDDVLQELDASGLEVAPFDARQARLAAELLPKTQRAGLSLGDRACLALAIDRGLPVLTADGAWANLGLPVEVILIR